jgi:hypothetical protein
MLSASIRQVESHRSSVTLEGGFARDSEAIIHAIAAASTIRTD